MLFLGNRVPDQFDGDLVNEVLPAAVADRLVFDLVEELVDLSVVGGQFLDHISAVPHDASFPIGRASGTPG
jgi:hypothetical protein